MATLFGGIVLFLGVVLGALTCVVWQMVWQDWHDEQWRSMRLTGTVVALVATFATAAILWLGWALVSGALG